MQAEVAKIYGKNESSILETVQEKAMCASFAVTAQIAKVKDIVCGKCLVKLEKALYLQVEDKNRKCALIERNMLHQEIVCMKILARDSKTFTASKVYYTDK